MSDSNNRWSHGAEKWVWKHHGRYLSDITVRPEVVKRFTVENWQKMGNDISQDTSLHSLSLLDCDLTGEVIESLFERNRTYNCPLEKICFSGNCRFGATGMAALLPLFKSISKLKELDFGYSDLGIEAMKILSEALKFVSVEDLDLRNNDIGDEGVDLLLAAPNSTHLVKLNLWQNKLGRRGYDAIKHFLARDDTAIKKIMFGSHFDEENEKHYAKILVDSISTKSKLEEIKVWEKSHNEEDDRMLPAIEQLERLVCDTTSFEALCESNHQLRVFSMRNTREIFSRSPILGEAIGINERSKVGASVAQRLRAKLRAFFLQGEFDIQPFIDMDVVLMPYVLELVTRTEARVQDEKKKKVRDQDKTLYPLCRGNLNGIYHLVRSCHLPELFSFPSPDSKMQELEARIAALERETTSLTLENNELRAGNGFLPNKRNKTIDG